MTHDSEKITDFVFNIKSIVDTLNGHPLIHQYDLCNALFYIQVH